MPYMLLVMEPPGQREARSLPEGHEAYDRMVRFGQNLRAKGILKAYDSLGSTAKGTRVQVRDGKRSMMDGPFAEAKEIVGGFSIGRSCVNPRIHILRGCRGSIVPPGLWLLSEVG